MKRTTNRKRTLDAVYFLKLPRSLKTQIEDAAAGSCVSANRLVRTAIIRLLTDLSRGGRVEWAAGYSRRASARREL